MMLNDKTCEGNLDDVKSIKHSRYGEIAYSTQEQVLIRRAIEKHNRLLKTLIVVVILLILTIFLVLALAYWTQLLGKTLQWLVSVRLR